MIKKNQTKKQIIKELINKKEIKRLFKNIIKCIKLNLIAFGKLVKVFLVKLFKTVTNFRKPRVYKLRGYTTTDRVDKKVSSEYNQRLLRNILVGAIFALLVALMILLFNPLKDIQELFRILGI